MRIVFYILLIIPLALKAQDPSYTQAAFNPVFLNPAFTGVNYGLKATLSSRTQWRNVTGKFNTHFLSVELAEGCQPMAFSVHAMQDNEGYNNLRTSEAGFAAAWHGRINRQMHLSGGLGFNYYNVSLNWDGLVFSNQLDPVRGQIGSSGVKGPAEGKSFLDVEGGIAMHFIHFAYDTRRIVTSVGISGHHLNKPDAGLVGTSRLPRRVNFHVVSDIPLKKSWKTQGYLMPYFFYNWQDITPIPFQTQREIQLGLNVYTRPILYGMAYHSGKLPFISKNTNELSLMVGYQQPFSNSSRAWQISYSYDFPLTSLSNSTFGSHELTLQIFLDNVHLACRGGGIENKCDLRTGGIPQIYSR